MLRWRWTRRESWHLLSPGFKRFLWPSAVFALAYYSLGFILLRAHGAGFDITGVVLLYFDMRSRALSPALIEARLLVADHLGGQPGVRGPRALRAGDADVRGDGRVRRLGRVHGGDAPGRRRVRRRGRPVATTYRLRPPSCGPAVHR